jgi:hypothetical protein
MTSKPPTARNGAVVFPGFLHAKGLVQFIQRTMASSPPHIRRRIVGLNDPRGARAQATESEQQRLALRHIARVEDLEIPSEEYTDGDDYSDSDSVDFRAHRQAPLQAPPAAAAAPAPAAAAASSARSRQLWQGNHAKLNIVASLFLLQPERQEMLAIASHDPVRAAAIRQFKRDPSRDLGHDNMKHAGKKFIIEKLCEELNEHAAFAQFLPANQRLQPELLRQKIREFQDIAVTCDEDSIDRSISLFINLIAYFLVERFI